MSEEEELGMMERNPKDTALFRARKQYLLEMVKMKYDLELMRQTAKKEQVQTEVDDLKKSGVQRQWKIMQDQQLLQAKYRKHMAKEKPVSMLGAGAPESTGYSPDLGLAVYLDYVIGVPVRVRQLQVVYSFYDGSQPKTEVKSLPLVATERLGENAEFVQAVVAVKRMFQKVFPSENLRLILEVQDVRHTATGPRTVPLGWTILPLFSSSAKLKSGLWRLDTYYPPVRFNASMQDMLAMKPVPNLSVYCRLVSGIPANIAANDNFIINPEATKMQYTPLSYLTALDMKAAKRPLHTTATAISRVVSVAKEVSRVKSGDNEILRVQSSANGIAPPSWTDTSLPQERVDAKAPKHGPIGEKRMGVDDVEKEGEIGDGKAEESAEEISIQMMIDGCSGSLTGHSHCEGKGAGVYIHVSVVDQEAGMQLPVLFSAHPSSDLRSVRTRCHSCGPARPFSHPCPRTRTRALTAYRDSIDSMRLQLNLTKTDTLAL